MRKPVISIITPTFNRKEYITQAIGSVQAQTFHDWEMIIVDDGSSDGTLQMLEEKYSNDARIRFFARKNRKKGACACRNEGLHSAAGDYVLFLDSDDLLAPFCLENRNAMMKKNPNADFSVFHTQIFFRSPGDSAVLWNIFNEDDDLDRFTAFDLVWGPLAILWKKRAIESIGAWNENLPSYQDFELHIRALAAGLNYFKQPERDSFYRMGTPDSIGVESQLSGKDFHLKSRIIFLETVTDILKQKKLLTPKRTRNLAELAAQFSEENIKRKKYLESIRIWILGWKLGLYKPGSFLKGMFFIFKKITNKNFSVREKMFTHNALWGNKTFYFFDQQAQLFFRRSVQIKKGENEKNEPEEKKRIPGRW